MSLKHVHILGINPISRAAIKAALKANLTVSASDLNSSHPLCAELSEEQQRGVDVYFGEHPQACLDRADCVVCAPGIIQSAEDWQNIINKDNWVSEIEFALLLNRITPPTIIGITGSYGKTTVASLLSESLKTSGIATTLAGRKECPLSAVESLKRYEKLVLELDYQTLALSHKLAIQTGVITSIYPENHVFPRDDYYIASKLCLALAVLNGGGTLYLSDQAYDTALQFLKRTELKKEFELAFIDNKLLNQNIQIINTTGLAPLQQAERFVEIILSNRPNNKTSISARLDYSTVPPGRGQRIALANQRVYVDYGALKGEKALEGILAAEYSEEFTLILSYRKSPCSYVLGSNTKWHQLNVSNMQGLKDQFSQAIKLYNAASKIIFVPASIELEDCFDSFESRSQHFLEWLRQESY